MLFFQISKPISWYYQYKACLYLFECNSHGNYKSSHKIQIFWHFFTQKCEILVTFSCRLLIIHTPTNSAWFDCKVSSRKMQTFLHYLTQKCECCDFFTSSAHAPTKSAWFDCKVSSRKMQTFWHYFTPKCECCDFFTSSAHAPTKSVWFDCKVLIIHPVAVLFVCLFVFKDFIKCDT